MNPTRWQRITDLFHAALELEGDARRAFLRDATAGDPDLLREIQSLLDSHSRADDGFLEEPAWGVAADLILDDGDSLQGRQIGNYRVGEEIGRGGMGVVYAAEDERLRRPVALKALTSEFTRDPVRRERLTREARAAAALSHASIATIYALEQIDGELYIISELVRGQTLREELAGGALPPDRLHATLVEIASALAAAHDQGIVHRDLKPENIMRRSDGHIKVLDFGLAGNDPAHSTPTLTRLTEAGVALGTPGYMAPEQITGAQVDARADIFAFGILAWELATGEHPFGADSAALLARMAELIEGRSASLSRALPVAGLDRVARRCMRAAPGDRYQSSDALLADLRALADPKTSEPMPDTGGDALWWWQFHQAAIAALNGATPIAGWLIRQAALRPYGSWIFFLTLALATLSVTLRLNLWFISRVHPASLTAQRSRLFPAIVTVDALLSAVLLAGSAMVAGEHDPLAAVLLTVALIGLASLALIEPATTRAAGLAGRA